MNINSSAVITSLIGTIKEKSDCAKTCDSVTLERILQSVKNLGTADYGSQSGESIYSIYQSALENLNSTDDQFEFIVLKLFESGQFPYFRDRYVNSIKAKKNVSFKIFKTLKSKEQWGRDYFKMSGFVTILSAIASSDSKFADELREVVREKILSLSDYEILLVSQGGTKASKVLSLIFVENLTFGGLKDRKFFITVAREELTRRKTEMKKDKSFRKNVSSNKTELIEKVNDLGLGTHKLALLEIKDKTKRMIRSSCLSKESLSSISSELTELSSELEDVVRKIKELVELNKKIGE